MQYFNVHTHSFTMRNAPQKFLQLYLPDFLADLVDRISDTEVGAKALEKILKYLGGNGGKRYSSFLQIGKSAHQEDVFEDLLEQYKDDTTIRFVALTMNMEFCGAGASLSGFEGQLEEVISLKKRYPDRLLIFLGIDPRWKDSGEELRDTVASYFSKKVEVNTTRSVYPFIGLKLYPSMGFYPFDSRLTATFEWAARHRVPIMSHCAYQGGIYNNDTVYLDSALRQEDPYTGQTYPENGIQYHNQKNLWKWLVGRQQGSNNLNKCSYFMEPAAFDSLLSAFARKGTPLKLCLAHFGGGSQLLGTDNRPYGAARKNWYLQITDMMKRYPTLYTDISYILSDVDTFPRIKDALNDVELGKRVLYGTDFFLTEREEPEEKDYQTFKRFASSTVLHNGQKMWDQIASLNSLEYLNSDFYDGNVF